jgi:hypothetical protein
VNPEWLTGRVGYQAVVCWNILRQASRAIRDVHGPRALELATFINLCGQVWLLGLARLTDIAVLTCGIEIGAGNDKYVALRRLMVMGGKAPVRSTATIAIAATASSASEPMVTDDTVAPDAKSRGEADEEKLARVALLGIAPTHALRQQLRAGVDYVAGSLSDAIACAAPADPELPYLEEVTHSPPPAHPALGRGRCLSRLFD